MWGMAKVHAGRIAAKLSEVFHTSPSEGMDLRTARIIILSDQHKGQGDGADDFSPCKRAYHAALGHYLESGHRLMVLGDAEELWECRPGPVLCRHADTLALEHQFYQRGRYVRFWGNHDDEWRWPEKVAGQLATIFGEMMVLEGLRLAVTQDGASLGTLFLVHGHQGTLNGDRWGWVSRFFVRHLWRNIQRLTRWRVNTPARDFQLRAAHDQAMYDWAAAQSKVVLIAGHTHRPVFTSRTHVQSLEGRLQVARAESGSTEPGKQEADLRAQLEWIRVSDAGAGPPAAKPCYFNSGCCCFDDGDITGLEILEGQIRLVRWPDDDGRPRPKLLASADLADVFKST